jgi:hypothetical protein
VVVVVVVVVWGGGGSSTVFFEGGIWCFIFLLAKIISLYTEKK